MRTEEIQETLNNVLKFMQDKVLPTLKNPEIYDFTCFTQCWGSTTLGFFGWGGSMLTSAITTIVEVESDNNENVGCSKWYVFFGGRFAYSVDGGNEKFIEDKAKGRMASVGEAYKRYKAVPKASVDNVYEHIKENRKNNKDESSSKGNG